MIHIAALISVLMDLFSYIREKFVPFLICFFIFLVLLAVSTKYIRAEEPDDFSDELIRYFDMREIDRYDDEERML